MAVANRKVLLFVLCLALYAGTLCRGEDAPSPSNLEAKATEAKQGAQDMMHDAEGKAESWAGWAYGKVTESLGLKQDAPPQEVARDVISQTKAAAADSMSTTASDLKSDSTQQNLKEEAKDKYEAAKEMASETAGNVGAKMRQASTEL
ncbi:hypothetical protein L6164_020047 [Bauhinia variegata]|uniref:Uncharacterized protein n=1 Tax=Bauhinia variegata TaxID=167791 RepID=A0ACB9MU69_BAUVA|nr:hypothetical protein L6164_020047 [Bauhinia variegata]